MKFRQIFPNWKNCEHVLGGIGAKNIYLRHFRLLDLGILDFSIMPAYAEATAWQAGPDVRGQITERFPRFRNVASIEPIRPRNSLSSSASREPEWTLAVCSMVPRVRAICLEQLRVSLRKLGVENRAGAVVAILRARCPQRRVSDRRGCDATCVCRAKSHKRPFRRGRRCKGRPPRQVNCATARLSNHSTRDACATLRRRRFVVVERHGDYPRNCAW